MQCPDCQRLLKDEATSCACGWAGSVKPAGPDYAWIARQREASMARVWATHTGTRACQSRLCPTATRALPGKQLCKACQAKEDAGEVVPRIGFIGNIRP